MVTLAAPANLHRVKAMWRLAPAERRLALESALMLGLACLAVRCAPASWLPSILRAAPAARRSASLSARRGITFTRRPGTGCSALQSAADRGVVLRMLDRVAAVHPLRPRCLEQAVAGRWMLARRGCASTLVIGARTHEFAAHAWLEIDGRAEPSSPEVARYEPLWRTPTHTRSLRDRGLCIEDREAS